MGLLKPLDCGFTDDQYSRRLPGRNWSVNSKTGRWLGFLADAAMLRRCSIMASTATIRYRAERAGRVKSKEQRQIRTPRL